MICAVYKYKLTSSLTYSLYSMDSAYTANDWTIQKKYVQIRAYEIFCLCMYSFTQVIHVFPVASWHYLHILNVFLNVWVMNVFEWIYSTWKQISLLLLLSYFILLHFFFLHDCFYSTNSSSSQWLWLLRR